jgi:hypothetical protein
LLVFAGVSLGVWRPHEKSRRAVLIGYLIHPTEMRDWQPRTTELIFSIICVETFKRKGLASTQIQINSASSLLQHKFKNKKNSVSLRTNEVAPSMTSWHSRFKN